MSPLALACHCTRITLTIPSPPSHLNECHCTICYKYGALWGYFHRKDVKITTDHGATLQKYIRSDEGSDGDVSFNRCSHCGCVMCWFGEGVPEGGFDGPERMRVNCRMAEETALEEVERRISRMPERKT